MVTATTFDFCYEFRGLSTDTKPTENIGNGSVFYELDTQNVYMFNATTSTWVLQ